MGKLGNNEDLFVKGLRDAFCAKMTSCSSQESLFLGRKLLGEPAEFLRQNDTGGNGGASAKVASKDLGRNKKSMKRDG